MTASIIGEFRIGADISVALDAVAGDPATVVSATAALRRANLSGGTVSFVRGAAQIAMLIAPRAASGDIPAGWNLTLAAAQSAALAPGTYGVDVRLQLAGGVVKTERSGVIRMTEAAL